MTNPKDVLGQALLAKKMGKTRLIAETGAVQHDVATAITISGKDCAAIAHYRGEDIYE